MSYKIIDIEGIGPRFTQKLEAAGVYTTADLLHTASSAEGRSKLEKKTKIPHKNLLKWLGMADLMRLNGIGKQFAELLKEAGVDTVKELKNRKPENLLARLEIIQQQKNLTKAVPSYAQLKLWINDAKELDNVITY